MNHLEPIPTLKCLSAATAAALGYVAITTRINPEAEPEIFQSVQDGLVGIDAVWIEVHGGFSAGRRKSELINEERSAS